MSVVVPSKIQMQKWILVKKSKNAKTKRNKKIKNKNKYKGQSKKQMASL
jgi:hypothetical protein